MGKKHERAVSEGTGNAANITAHQVGKTHMTVDSRSLFVGQLYKLLNEMHRLTAVAAKREHFFPCKERNFLPLTSLFVLYVTGTGLVAVCLQYNYFAADGKMFLWMLHFTCFNFVSHLHQDFAELVTSLDVLALRTRTVAPDVVVPSGSIFDKFFIFGGQ